MSAPEPFTADELLGLYLHFDYVLTAAEPVTAEDTADAITRLSVAWIPGVEQASISEARHGRFYTRASTGPMATAADRLQHQLRTGPCIDALTNDVITGTGGVAADTRWTELARRATAETGVVSMLSYRLYFEEDRNRATALNLYSAQRDAFDDTANTVGTVLATDGGRALLAATFRERAANLEKALGSNLEIGAATGILMGAHKLTRDDAFNLLRAASQHLNRKLGDIATEIVDTGLLPLPPKPAAAADERR